MKTFSEINLILMSNPLSYLYKWLPDGHVSGNEFVALNPKRNDKTKGSFRVNFITGRWADFATNDRGGDLISLYAYINNISNGKAANELQGKI